VLSSAVRNFTEPDAYAAAIRQSTIRLTISERGHFTAQIIRIDLHRLWMQRFSESLPRVVHTDSAGARAVISFRTRPGPDLSWGGFYLQPGQLIRHVAGGSCYQHSTGATGIGAMSLPLEDMAAAAPVIAGYDLTPPRDALLVTPRAASMARLQRLHAAAGHLAETAPEVITHPEAARGLEQALIEAMVDCLTTGGVAEEHAAQRRHGLILRRFYGLIEESPDQPLYVPEICKAIGVAERTLRTCCQEHLGMSPKHYLLRRRMHLARRDLCQSTSSTTTVTEVAGRYGFWHFGRFASAYKSLFGELPLVTLGRAPE
jgi:AraC-like DNA-binding protein